MVISAEAAGGAISTLRAPRILIEAGQTRSTNVSAIADLRKGAWQTPTLNAPWTHYASGYATCGYRRDGIHVQFARQRQERRGRQRAVHLPASVRPPAQLSFATLSDPNGLARIDIKAIWRG